MNLTRYNLLFLLALSLFGAGCGAKKNTGGQKSDGVSYNTRKTFNQHYYEGAKQKALGNFTESAAEFNKALEYIPNSHEVMYQLANVYFKDKKIQDAMVWAEKAVKANPDYSYWYYGQLGQIYNVLKLYDKSAATFAVMVEKEPNRKANYEEAGNQYLNAGKMKEAAKYFEKYITKFGVTEDVCRKLESAYLELNMPNDALRVIKKLSESNPTDVRYLGLLAETNLKLNKVTEAKTAYQKILEIEPGNGYAAFGMADVLRREGDNEKSFEYLALGFSDSKVNIQHKLKVISSYYFLITKDAKSREQAFKLSKILVETYPNDAMPYQVMSDMYLAIDKYPESREYLKKSLAIDGKDYRLWQKLFGIDVKLANNQFLYDDSKAAMELFTTQIGLFIIHSQAAMRVGEYDRAIETSNAGLDIAFKSDERIQFYLTLADSWFEKGNSEKADQYYQKAIETDQQNALALNDYAYNLFKRNTQLDKAEEMVLKALKLEPDNGSFADTYGCILMAKGKLDEAEIWIKKSLKLEGENPEVLEHLGDLYMKMGKNALALETYKKAISKDPENPSLKKKLLN